MKILAIDTSSRVLSTAVCDNNRILAKSRCTLLNGHSSMLVPLIEKVLEKSGLCLDELDAFGVSIGPGSFTGLRVGVTTVKGLSYAAGKPVVPVPTLDVIAWNVKRTDKAVCVICDARRGMVYSLLFRNLSRGWQESLGTQNFLPPKINKQCRARHKREKILLGSNFCSLSSAELSPQKLLNAPATLATPCLNFECASLENVEKMLRKIDGPTLFIGDGLRVYRAQIEEYCNGRFPFEFADERLWFPKAENVARIAEEFFKEGKTANPFSLVPLYLHPKDCSVVKGRKTKAERMLNV